MGKFLLLISNMKEDLEFSTEVAISAGLSLRNVQNPVEGAAIIAEENPSVVFVNASTEQQYHSFEEAVQTSVGLFSDKANSNSIHYISSSLLADSKYLITSPIFGHFILRTAQDFKNNGEQYGRIVKATLKDRAFGLEQLLKSGTKIQTAKLKHSSQKQSAVDAVKSYLIAGRFQPRMATVVANTVDELLMYAIFDAPIDITGKSTIAHLPRTTSLPLDGKQAVDMSIGFDGKNIGISVSDQYGSLDKANFISLISKLYKKEEFKLKTTAFGGGIGIANSLHLGGSFFCVNESRVKTEITALFRICDHFRDFKNQFRFVSTQFYV